MSAFSVNDFLVRVLTQREDQYKRIVYDPVNIHHVSDYLNSDLPSYWLCEEGSMVSSGFFGQNMGDSLSFGLDYSWSYEGKESPIAVIVSVQGINVLTCKPIRETRLEEYDWECPEHEIPLDRLRYCSLCGHTWPTKNYFLIWNRGVSNKSEVHCRGFRVTDKFVRNFVFSDSRKKTGIAQQLVGENCPHEISFAFFRKRGDAQEQAPRVFSGVPSMARFSMKCGVHSRLYSQTSKIVISPPVVTQISAGTIQASFQDSTDGSPLSSWCSSPSGIIQLNHADNKWVQKLTKDGPTLDRDAGGEGPLAKLKVMK